MIFQFKILLPISLDKSNKRAFIKKASSKLIESADIMID